MKLFSFGTTGNIIGKENMALVAIGWFNIAAVYDYKVLQYIEFTFKTFVLVMIGYLSLYYGIDNFTDRTMVVLTTMLVIATITSSIESVINKLN